MKSTHNRLFATVLIALAAPYACTLITEVDRSKIAEEDPGDPMGGESSTGDGDGDGDAGDGDGDAGDGDGDAGDGDGDTGDGDGDSAGGAGGQGGSGS